LSNGGGLQHNPKTVIVQAFLVAIYDQQYSSFHRVKWTGQSNSQIFWRSKEQSGKHYLPVGGTLKRSACYSEKRYRAYYIFESKASGHCLLAVPQSLYLLVYHFWYLVSNHLSKAIRSVLIHALNEQMNQLVQFYR